MSKKYLILGTVGLIIIAAGGYLSLEGKNLGNSLHAMSHDLGFCACESLAANGNGVAASASQQACAPAKVTATYGQFTENERKVVEYICDNVVANGKTSFDDKELEKATGVSLETTNVEKIKGGVLAELNRRQFKFSSLGGGYCSKFSACSVDRDLSGATGEELERYKLEKSQDGTTFTDFMAPDFTLPTTDGKEITLSDYQGKPVAVIFLSGHCSHSLDTLPILTELTKKYESRDLVILPVYVNSGSVEDVKTWSSEMNLGYPLIVSKNKDLSKAYNSRMVPSTFLIDREGRVVKKLVGYKDKSILDQAFNGLVGLRS